MVSGVSWMIAMDENFKLERRVRYYVTVHLTYRIYVPNNRKLGWVIFWSYFSDTTGAESKIISIESSMLRQEPGTIHSWGPFEEVNVGGDDS